jgi:hypothetical protein
VGGEDARNLPLANNDVARSHDGLADITGDRLDAHIARTDDIDFQ